MEIGCLEPSKIKSTFEEKKIVGREAFDPVCKGPPYKILVFLTNFHLAKRDNFMR